MQELRSEDIESYLARPNSAVVVGLLSCEACSLLTSALADLEIGAWRFAYVHLPPRAARGWIEQGIVTSYPTLLGCGPAGQEVRLDGCPGRDRMSIQSAVKRLLSK